MTTYDYSVIHIMSLFDPERGIIAAGEVFVKDTHFVKLTSDGWEPYLTAGDGRNVLVVFLRRSKEAVAYNKEELMKKASALFVAELATGECQFGGCDPEDCEACRVCVAQAIISKEDAIAYCRDAEEEAEDEDDA